MCISHLKVEVCCDSEEWATGQLALGLIFFRIQNIAGILKGLGDVAWSYSTCTLLDAYLPKVIKRAMRGGRLYLSELTLQNEYLSKIDFQHNIGDKRFRSNKRKEEHSKMRKHAHEFGARRKCIRLSAVVRVQRSLQQ